MALRSSSGEIPIALTSSTTSIFYISLTSSLLKGYKIKVTEVDPETAIPKSQHTLRSENELGSEESIFHVGSKTTSPVVVWSDKDFKTLKVNILGTKGIHTINVPSDGKEKIEEIFIHTPKSGKAFNHFLAHYQTKTTHWGEVYHIDPNAGTVKKAYELQKVGGKGAFSVSTIDSSVYFTRHTEAEVNLVSSTSHEIIERWLVLPSSNLSLADPEGVNHAVSEVASKGASGFAIRSALALPSGDWKLVRNGETAWTRSESLTGVVAAAWAEIPREESLAKELEVESHDDVIAAYIHRVKRHFKDLRYLPAWLQNIPGRILASFIGGTTMSQNHKLQRDTFGFSKIIIVATEKGRVIALDSALHGEILWNVQAVKLAPGSTWNVTGLEVEDNLALIMAADAEFVLIETITGNIRQYQKGGTVPNIDKFISISKGSGKRTLVPVYKDGRPDHIPPGEFTDKTFIVTQGPDGSVSGWHLVDGKESVLAWAFHPALDEIVSTVSSRPIHDPVASIGRALGDRDVLYKYLSSNLVLITTTNKKASSVSVHLLDSVTGETLYTTIHTAIDTTKPISATFSENWFAYTLYSDPSLATASTSQSTPKSPLLVISELYESPIPNDRGPLGPSLNTSSLSSASYSPYVVTATYVTPSVLTHLTTTSTKQGITPRSLLAYSSSLAALLAIPIPLLSPRKPVGRDPTAAEREEGLFRYSPFLDFNPQWTLSHQRELLGVKGVVAVPTLMESTSLVFAYGDLDLFGTRVAPIGAFDLLGKGFGRVQLVLTVVALGVGTGVLAPMVSYSISRSVHSLYRLNSSIYTNTQVQVRKKQIDGLWKG